MYDNPHPMDNLLIKDLMQRFKRPVNKEYIIPVEQDESEYHIIVRKVAPSVFDIKQTTGDYPPGFDYSIDA